MEKLLFFVIALAAVSAMPQYHHGGYHQALHAGPVVHAAPVVKVAEHVAPAHYKFSYGVSDPHTHDIKEQEETREGHNVQGHYSLVEPDGTRRVVHYTADEHNGFNAVVQREGHASHPAQVAHKVVAAPVVAHHSAPAISHLGYAHAGHGYH